MKAVYRVEPPRTVRGMNEGIRWAVAHGQERAEELRQTMAHPEMVVTVVETYLDLDVAVGALGFPLPRVRLAVVMDLAFTAEEAPA